VLHCQIVAKSVLMSTVDHPLPTSLRKDAAGVAPGGSAEAEASAGSTSHVSRDPALAPSAPSAPGAGTPALAPAGGPDGRPREIGGRDGPEPTRFGDWEKSGRCIDF
jgi:hypothetical protein